MGSGYIYLSPIQAKYAIYQWEIASRGSSHLGFTTIVTQKGIVENVVLIPPLIMSTILWNLLGSTCKPAAIAHKMGGSLHLRIFPSEAENFQQILLMKQTNILSHLNLGLKTRRYRTTTAMPIYLGESSTELWGLLMKAYLWLAL